MKKVAPFGWTFVSMEKMTPPGRTFCFHRNLTPFVKDQFVLVSKFIGKHLPSTSTCPSNIKFDIESIISGKVHD
jgi:hypothetical protein